jgi:hypothetical protein
MNKTAHIKVINYFVRAFKNTKRIYLRNPKYFRGILRLCVRICMVGQSNYIDVIY